MSSCSAKSVAWLSWCIIGFLDYSRFTKAYSVQPSIIRRNPSHFGVILEDNLCHCPHLPPNFSPLSQ
jgi:hypothetical protein